jgi:hypothetical protein
MDEQPPDVTLNTLDHDLTRLGAEMRDLKVSMVTGFASMPTRASSEEIIRLLREGNRINEPRFTELDVQIREQQLETLHIPSAVAGHQQALTADVRELGIQNEALMGRIDALIRRRDNGGSV